MISVKKEIINGVFWNAVAKYSSVIVQLGVTAILARLITPEEFGIVAIATVLITFFSIFSDMGLGSAIIQRQDLTNKDYSSIYSFSVYLSMLLGLLFFIASYPIASYYKNNELELICQLLSLNLLFSTLNLVPNALISKARRFKFIAKRTLFFQIIGGIASSIAALCGMGCYALLFAPIISSIGMYIINMNQCSLKFNIIIDWSPIQKTFSYSFFLLIFNIFNYFTRNLDKLIIGRYFSMNELGYYDKSYRLMMLPLQQITSVISPVLHPVFAEFQHDYKKLAHDYKKIIKFLACISFPMGVFFYFGADNMIYILYGQNWMKAVPCFEILALSVPMQMIISTTGGIYAASGKTNWLFYAGCFHSIITIIGFFLAAHYWNTVEAVAWAFVITMNIHTFISLFVIYKIIFKESYWPVIKVMLIPFGTACVLIIALLGIDLIIHNHFFSLIIQGILCVIITLIIIQLTHLYNLKELYFKIRSKIKH